MTTPSEHLPAHLPPRGWYPDPSDPTRERHWSGQAWTQRVRRRTEAVPLPVHHRVEPSAVQKAHPVAPRTGPAPSPEAPRPAPTGLLPGPGSGQGRPPASPTVPLAGWWRRAVAAAIDYLIESAMLAVALMLVARDFVDRLSVAYGDWFGQAFSTLRAGRTDLPELPDQLLTQLSWLSTLIAVVTLVYAVVFLGAWGATPGQRLLGLRVIPLPEGSETVSGKLRQVDGAQAAGRVGWRRAVWRGLIWSILLSGSYFTVLLVFSALMPLWQSRRQTVPDLLAQTIVVRHR